MNNIELIAPQWLVSEIHHNDLLDARNNLWEIAERLTAYTLKAEVTNLKGEEDTILYDVKYKNDYGGHNYTSVKSSADVPSFRSVQVRSRTKFSAMQKFINQFHPDQKSNCYFHASFVNFKQDEVKIGITQPQSIGTLEAKIHALGEFEVDFAGRIYTNEIWHLLGNIANVYTYKIPYINQNIIDLQKSLSKQIKQCVDLDVLNQLNKILSV